VSASDNEILVLSIVLLAVHINGKCKRGNCTLSSCDAQFTTSVWIFDSSSVRECPSLLEKVLLAYLELGLYLNSQNE